MQTIQKAEREKSNAQSSRFCKRIGSTLYEVNVYFNEAAKESLDDKIFRLISNDTLKKGEKYGNIEMLQTERLPERGSI